MLSQIKALVCNLKTSTSTNFSNCSNAPVKTVDKTLLLDSGPIIAEISKRAIKKTHRSPYTLHVSHALVHHSRSESDVGCGDEVFQSTNLFYYFLSRLEMID